MTNLRTGALGLLLCAAWCAAGCVSEAEPGPEVPEPGEAGPWAVGAIQVSFPSPAHGWEERSPSAWVWYPARPEASGPTVEYFGSFSGDAMLAVGPDREHGPYPVIAFSHGYGGFSAQSIFLTEHLASRGFVVIAPDHLGNTLFDLDDLPAWHAAYKRPTDISLALDLLLGAGEAPLAGLADPQRIGVTGHSFGAWTSLALTGTEIDVAAFRSGCGEPCPALEGLPQSGSIQLSDERISASLPLTPGGLSYLTPSFSAAVTVPTAILAAELDETLPIDTEALPIFESITVPKAMYTVLGAGHFSFSHMCDILPGFGDGCGDEFLDVERVFRITNEVADAFFGHTLQDAERFERFPGCAWEEVDCAIP